MYNFKEGHTIVVGLTQSGKTYAVNKSLLKEQRGVLFFNTQQEDLEGYIKANKKTSFIQIMQLLKKGYKVNYIPDTRLKIQFVEIEFLINQLFENGNFNKNKSIFFVVDEAHLFTGDALDAITRIATSGIRWGINGVFISQRPANLNNTLMTQSTHILIFMCNMESQYFKNYSIPIESILQAIKKNGKYSFCEYDFLTITEYKKI